MADIYKLRQWSLALFRAALGVIFLYHGYLKLFAPGGFKGTIGFFSMIGIPYPPYAALLVSLVEFAGGLFLIFGFLAKWASLALIINMLVALFKVHLQNGFLIANNGLEFVALIILSLIVILLNGPGSLSLDRAILGAEEEHTGSEARASKKMTSKKSARKPGIKVRYFEGNGVVASTGIDKEPGYLYFLDKNGDVARVKMARRGERTSKKQEVLAKVGVKRKEGYLYFIDSNGNVAQAKMARG